MSTELALIETISASEIDSIVKYWWTCWMGMHLGFRRHAVVYWVCTGTISPVEAWQVLGIPTAYPLDLIIFYRELAITQTPEYDLAQQIVQMTPEHERKAISRFFAGRNAFESGQFSRRSIANLIDAVTVPSGLPKLRQTDDGPDGSIATARMVFDGLRRTHTMRSDAPPREKGTTPLLFVSADCQELISTLPTLISDPKNPEDTLRVQTIQDDVWEACKNAYRDYLSVRASAPIEVLRQQAIELADTPTGQYMNLLKFNSEQRGQGKRARRR
jgi:hypothetical protein